jgi:hypothetical protein
MRLGVSVSRLDPRTLLPIVALMACACGGGTGAETEQFDRGRLERQEDLSEALANDLLKFSVAVRDRDYGKIEDFVADAIRATPLPPEAPTAVPVVKWVERREWGLAAAENLDRAGFLDRLRVFLDRFEEIDDARFKVKAAEFDDAAIDRGAAKIKFFIVARDEAGRRDWLRGTAHIEVSRTGDEPWRLSLFEIDALESSLATEDLFSEIAFPAGVSALYPRFGEGRNEGFVSHGAATADVNGDGLLDLAASGVEQNYLYINRGDGTFRDVSEESLVKFAPIGAGALFLDFDNDGDADLFFAAVGKQVLLENRLVPDGEMKFWDISEKAGVDRDAVGFSVVAADVNADGFTDVYVCSYNRYGTVMPNSWYAATNGTPNLLFINRGDGTFREASGEWGVQDSRWSYAAGFVDIDEDGDQDLYVANDFGENALYINEGDRFADEAERYGIVDPGFGMGVSFGDYDNDGDLDLHVTNMSSTAGQRILKLLYPPDHEIFQTLFKQAEGNSLYANENGGRFRNVTSEVGGLSGGWAFGGGFVDFDNDGWQDLYTPNGFVSGKTMDDT